MSFLNVLASSPGRAEELRHAWQSLSYDVLSHSSPITPPLTPESSYQQQRSDMASARVNPKMLPSTSCDCWPPLFVPPQCSTQKIAWTETKNILKRKATKGPAEGFPEKKYRMEDVACHVHGILSLPGCRERRFNISPEELRRRVNQPECLTKVDMISYVRLAKNSARTLLEKHNIKTNQHNQRSEHTVLSKMCEAECQTLANGIRDLNYRYFPGSWFAAKSAQEISNNNQSTHQRNEAMKERRKEDEITKCVLLDIYFGLEKRKKDEEMNVFNLISHSFGVVNLQNHILFLLSYIEEELRVLRNA